MTNAIATEQVPPHSEGATEGISRTAPPARSKVRLVEIFDQDSMNSVIVSDREAAQ